MSADSGDVFVSTYALPPGGLRDALRYARDCGFMSIELGSSTTYEPELETILDEARKAGMKFLVHNYFPAPQQPFVLNLASADSAVRKRSVDHCRRAIDLTHFLGADFYSFHAGFAFEVTPKQLGKTLRPAAVFSAEDAYRRFVDAVHEIAEYAASRHIRLAVENHVLTRSNANEGKGDLLLMIRGDDFFRFAEEFPPESVGFLIDVGHLAVTARTLGFHAYEFLKQVVSRTLAVHLSNNDSLSDENLTFDSGAWFMEALPSFRRATMILECRPFPAEEISRCCRTIQEALGVADKC